MNRSLGIAAALAFLLVLPGLQAAGAQSGEPGRANDECLSPAGAASCGQGAASGPPSYFEVPQAAAGSAGTALSPQAALPPAAAAPAPADTLLMFVGEDLEVLTVASRRRESAWQAPAVARVVTREEIRERGLRTLGQALALEPGFHLARKEWGTLPYLRGIPNSVLFLYDTVPLGSDVTRSLHPLDNELSLASLKRVEILRGPGSVLWGPDAFAGIVNLVPLTGKDLDGAEAGASFGTRGAERSFFANFGRDAGSWDGFLSLSGRAGGGLAPDHSVSAFWGDGLWAVPPDERYGGGSPSSPRAFEVSGRLAFGDWLTLSGLLADSRRGYTLTLPAGDLSWGESRRAPLGLLKLEAKKELDRASALRFMGSFGELSPEYEIIDRTLRQRERTLYAELIYDRTLLAGRGLLTAGASYRDRKISGAPLWNGYLPDYLGPDNWFLLPEIASRDYRASLISLFAQYRHRLEGLDLTAGVRSDDHDEYRSRLSYNLGAVWTPAPSWLAKLLYGVAYRTPLARQLLEEGRPEPEEIETLSLQLAWKPAASAQLSVTGFLSRIDRHVMEDPYAGLSLPNRQRFRGLELEGRLLPAEGLELAANATLLANHGPAETYHWNDYSFLSPDGTVVRHYTDLSYPYDRGPGTLFNLMAAWRPAERLSAFARLGYTAGRDLIYPRGGEVITAPSVWLLDAALTVRDVALPGLDVELSGRNLLDRRYLTPGTYSLIPGEPASFWLGFRYKW